MRYQNIYKHTNRKPKRTQFGKFERPEVEKMQSKFIKCWKCGEFVKSKPVFVRGIKKFEYYDRDNNKHGCEI